MYNHEVTLQFATSIYHRYMFMVQATGKFYNIWNRPLRLSRMPTATTLVSQSPWIPRALRSELGS
jgi:hypothetical protein